MSFVWITKFTAFSVMKNSSQTHAPVPVIMTLFFSLARNEKFLWYFIYALILPCFFLDHAKQTGFICSRVKRPNVSKLSNIIFHAWSALKKTVIMFNTNGYMLDAYLFSSKASVILIVLTPINQYFGLWRF